MVGGWGGRNVPPAHPQPTVSLLPFHQPGSQHVRQPCPHSRWVFPFQITLGGNIPANSLGNSKLVEQMTVKMDHLASRCKVFKLSSSPLWWERGRVIFFFFAQTFKCLDFHMPGAEGSISCLPTGACGKACRESRKSALSERQGFGRKIHTSFSYCW